MFDFGAIFFLLAAFPVAYLVVVLLKRNDQKGSDKRRPPSLPSLPIVGSLPFLEGGLDETPRFFMRKAETLGPVFHFYAGNNLALVVNGRKAVVDALQHHSEAFGDRPDFWTEKNVLNGNLKGIGFAHYGDSFKQMHKLVISILKEFGFGEAKETEHRILEEVEVMLRTIHEQNGRAFYPNYTFSMVPGTVINKILFGRKTISKIDNRSLVEASNEFVIRLEPKFNTAPIIRFLPKYRNMITDQVSSQAKLMAIMNEAIKLCQSDDSENNFVKRYLEIEGPDYDHEDFLYILRDLNLGSADTVSTTMQWALIELANHPQVQVRLQKEIDDLIPDTRLPSLDDKPRLPYSEAVIMEAMRRHTLLPFGLPHMTYKDTEVGGYSIPRGCMVLPNIYSVHMDPKEWIDPENFRPERFLDNEKLVNGKNVVIPFSLGKRACIGEILARQQVFLVFTSLVHQFDFRPPGGQDKVTFKEEFTLFSRPTAYEIRMIPRKKAYNPA